MTMQRTRRPRASRLRGVALTALAVTLGAACADDTLIGAKKPGEETVEENDPTSWNPSGETGECNVDALLSPYSYAAKVKTLLTGLPLDDAELAQVEDDPEALRDMIDGWIETPEARHVLERFFMTAFQQNNLDIESFFYLMGRAAAATGFFSNPRSPNVDEMLNQNMMESFGRTAAELVERGRPFTEVITTDEMMMTTAQLAYLAYIDDDVVDDDGNRSLRTTVGDFPTITILRDEAAAPPPEQALDPNHANFGRFWHGAIASLDTGCNVAASQTIDTTGFTTDAWRIANGSFSPSHWVAMAMFGRHESIRRHPNTCNTGAANRTPLLSRDDFSDWRMVKISKPTGVETATKFYDLPTLRSATEVKLHTHRRGFYSTPGFHGTWQNNEDNSSRVTINQILIVALGESFEGDAVSDFSPENLDEEHAAPDSDCYGCHQTLDPMRDFVRASYTNFYGEQLDEERKALQADFVFHDVVDEGVGVDDLGQILASHPAFPYAWAQKLCYFANSSPCPEGAELDRVAAAFTDSGFDFRVLVRELFSSPFITGSACLEGVDAGTTATIARRGQFCDQLSHRLGMLDVCSMRTHSRDASNLQDDVAEAVASVPEDSFSRAEIAPVVIGETGLFTRANREAACTVASQEGFSDVFTDVPADTVLTVLVEGLMGLPPSDPRHDGARAILEDHVDEVMALEETEEVALQSAFVLACMSPTSAGVGF